MRTVDSILRGLKSPVVQGKEVRGREATSSWVCASRDSGAGGLPGCPDHKRFLRFPNGSRGRDPAGIGRIRHEGPVQEIARTEDRQPGHAVHGGSGEAEVGAGADPVGIGKFIEEERLL